MEITNITVSYSRKINHALYGGGQYESSDHFISLAAEIGSDDDLLAVHDELRTACQERVEIAVLDELTSFQGGITADRFFNYIRDLVANRPIDSETYQECNKSQKAVLQAIKRGKQMKKRDDLKDDNQ